MSSLDRGARTRPRPGLICRLSGAGVEGGGPGDRIPTPMDGAAGPWKRMIPPRPRRPNPRRPAWEASSRFHLLALKACDLSSLAESAFFANRRILTHLVVALPLVCPGCGTRTRPSGVVGMDNKRLRRRLRTIIRALGRSGCRGAGLDRLPTRKSMADQGRLPEGRVPHR